ncbi:hypothetical protein QQX98_013009 [Neonectria punicea]|uniref:Uncharacterized protein n=1 Tax=Neonectria punicea TaxID=979145 RepID=A0ABR1GH67_9HYPO
MPVRLSLSLETFGSQSPSSSAVTLLPSGTLEERPEPAVLNTSPHSLDERYILCEKHIEQTSEQIRIDIKDLLVTPPDTEEWQCYLVPAEEWEAKGSIWSDMGHLPPIHHVRKTADGEHYMMALADGCVGVLREYGLQFEQVRTSMEYDGREFSAAEGRIHGACEARRRYRRRFIRNATRGLEAKESKGLGRLYQSITVDEGSKAAIEWARLITGLLRSKTDALDQFFLSCLFLCLHLLGDLTSPSSLELIKKDRKSWCGYLRYLCASKTAGPAEDAKAEMHQISLLLRLSQSARCGVDDSQYTFDTKLSTNENLAVIGDIFELDFDEHVSVGRFESQAFQTVEGFEELRDEIYMDMPWLKMPKNDWRVLICYHGQSQVEDEELHRYMLSMPSENFCWRDLYTPEQAGLTLSAILWLKTIRLTVNQSANPDGGARLSCYLQLISGRQVRASTATLRSMLSSIKRVRPCHPAAVRLLDGVILGAPHVPMDALQGLYWKCWFWLRRNCHSADR